MAFAPLLQILQIIETPFLVTIELKNQMGISSIDLYLQHDLFTKIHSGRDPFGFLVDDSVVFKIVVLQLDFGSNDLFVECDGVFFIDSADA